jgi:hypothetical protein
LEGVWVAFLLDEIQGERLSGTIASCQIEYIEVHRSGKYQIYEFKMIIYGYLIICV